MRVILLHLLLCLTLAQNTAPIVATKSGPIQGYYEEGTAVFKGIPFAKPPTGNLRWRLPEPPEPWKNVKNTTHFGNTCYAILSAGSIVEAGDEDEDCLSLNVWVPKTVWESKKKVPVMVFIHGGAFILGSSGNPVTSPDPEQFARENSLVFVSMNYRLGPLGFFGHPQLGGYANFGLYDQILALKWVHDNILLFHGDPEHVTLSGSSAGAISICFLIGSPLAKGLFHRTVFQSTLCDMDFDNQEKAFDQSAALAEAVGCKATDIDCLRTVSPKALSTALPLGRGILWTKGVKWFPIIEGTENSVSPIHPFLAIKNGVDPEIDSIVGWTRDEGSLFLFLGFPLYIPRVYLNTVLKNTFKDDYRHILEGYKIPVNENGDPEDLSFNSDFAWVAVRILSDIWECSSLRLAKALSAKGNRVHTYEFMHPPSYIRWPLNTFIGVPHGVEMNFVYKSKRVTLTTEEEILSTDILKVWGWFVKHEEPWDSRQSITDEDRVLLHWPEYGETNKTLLLAPGKYKYEELPAHCEFWDKLVTPKGFLLFPVPEEEPWFSWFINVVLFKLTKHVTTIVGVAILCLVAYCFRRRNQTTTKIAPTKELQRKKKVA